MEEEWEGESRGQEATIEMGIVCECLQVSTTCRVHASSFDLPQFLPVATLPKQAHSTTLRAPSNKEQ